MARKKVKAKAPAKSSGVDTNTQFLEALKLYEGKQYKKSNKILDTLIKKGNKDSQTLSLKGLNFQFIGEKEEAAQCIKNATDTIKNYKATAICCHVLGIYFKTVKQYEESTKWFQASIDNGSENHQIYRDLANLYSQIGDFKNALANRKKYWQSFLGYRANWTALAIAHDINGERQQSVNILSQFEQLSEGKISEAEAFEHSECLMYKNDVMYKAAGDNKDKLKNVLNHLNDIEPKTFDKFSILERKASILMKLGEFQKASIVYRTLIKRNPDNFNYYKLLEVSLGVNDNNKLRKMLYEKFAQFYPRCEPPKYIPLTFIQDEGELKKKLQEYIIPQLKRSVPATFSNVKPLYKKRTTIVPKILIEIVNEFFEAINVDEKPSVFIWTCYYLSQHYLFMKDFNKAQEFIDKAIEHTPTVVEFYILKGRILKHIGLLDEAAKVVDEGRQLDLQDRFINCKAVKYYLRSNNIDKAVEIVSLFTKNENSVNGVKDLHLVEASWFIVEQAESYYRLYLNSEKKLNSLKVELEELTRGDETVDEKKQTEVNSQIKDAEWECIKYKGLSLKRFNAISKFYNQFEDDKLDFHSYCMRKGTPRAYLEMLNWGDNLYTKPMYIRSMQGASKIYFEIYNQSLKRKLSEMKNANGKGNGDEKIVISNKKLKKEAAALHKRREQEKKFVIAYSENDDNDIFGEELINTKTPMVDFNDIFYNNYSKQIREDELNYIIDFQYHVNADKLALCLGSINKCEKQNGNKSAIFGAMLVTLLLISHGDKDIGLYDSIAKQVVLKSLNNDYKDLISFNELENADFDWIEFLQDKFNIKDCIKSLLFIYQFENIYSTDLVKQYILESIAKLDPVEQNRILQYEL